MKQTFLAICYGIVWSSLNSFVSSASTVITGCRWELRWKVVPGHKRHFYLFLIYVVSGDLETECDYAAAARIAVTRFWNKRVRCNKQTRCLIPLLIIFWRRWWCAKMGQKRKISHFTSKIDDVFIVLHEITIWEPSAKKFTQFSEDIFKTCGPSDHWSYRISLKSHLKSNHRQLGRSLKVAIQMELRWTPSAKLTWDWCPIYWHFNDGLVGN